MRNFRDLKIWKRSFKLANNIYEQSKGMPNDEKFGLTSQIRRSAVSIPSNIAEGCSRRTNKDFTRFLEIALGSSFELETQLMFVYECIMLENKKVEVILHELNQIQKMINSFRSQLKTQTDS